MTLPDAIRIGAMLKPQCTGGRMDGDASCALAAAAEAVGIPPRRDVVSGFLNVSYQGLIERFPILRRPTALPNATSLNPQGAVLPLYEVIYLLNDILGWTREQIADWVEPIERESPAETVHAVTVP